MTAIMFKEIKSYFKSIFGWIYLAVFTFFAGAYFVGNNINYGSPYISDSLGAMVIVLIFLLPLLTMRIIAEEKRQKTDQFLITAPISLVKVIIGKFLSLCAIMLLSTLIVAIGVGIMAIYGKIPVAENIFSLVGFFLFGCECIAIGMFLSSVTEHQFLAAIFTYTVYIFTLIVPYFAVSVFGQDKLITKIISATDIYQPFNGMLTGVINFNDLIYIFSVIAIFLILTYKIFAKNSVQISAVGKNRFFIANFIPFLIIAAIIGANIGCRYIPSKYMQHDFTKEGWYTISDETKNILKGLNEDYTIYVYASKDEVDENVKLYVDSYDSYSKHINVEYRPQNKYPNFAAQYSDKALTTGALIVEKGSEYKVIDYYSLYKYNMDHSGQYQLVGIDVEGQVTAAILALENGDAYVKAYCLAGHNEVPLPENTKERLNKAGYIFGDYYLLGKEVPDDCALLIINGPQSDLDESEVEAIKKYIDKGGKIFMTAAFEVCETENYDALIESLGVELTDGTVIERDYNRKYKQDDGSLILASPDYASPFQTGSNKQNFLYKARGIKYDNETLPVDTVITDIFVSGNDSYAKEIGLGSVTADYDEGAEDGPFRLGVYINKTNRETMATSQIIIVTSAGFLYNDYDLIVSRGNTDLFVNMVTSIVDSSIKTTIPVKELTYEYIAVSAGMVMIYAAICCAIVPLAFIVTGFVIMIMRRRK